MACVSLWLASRVQVLVSSPAVVQAAGVVTVHSPQSWTCSGSGLLLLSGVGSGWQPVSDKAMIANNAIVKNCFLAFMLNAPFLLAYWFG